MINPRIKYILDFLEEEKIQHRTGNHGIHIIATTIKNRYDIYPTTGRLKRTCSLTDTVVEHTGLLPERIKAAIILYEVNHAED